MHKPTCPREVISRGALGSIELCPCGTVHLTIGAVTLRLVPDAIAELAEIIGQAAVEISTRSARRATWRLEPEAAS